MPVMTDTTDTGRPDTSADTDMTAATVTLVTTSEAARLAGVSARTVRRWVQRGLLASVASDGGQLVSPADLPAAKAASGGGHGHGHGHGHVPVRGHGHGRVDTDTDTDTDIPAGAVSPAAVAQLEAIRDEWLAPLVARIEELARENGTLRERAAMVEQDRDRLAAEVARDRGLADRLVDLLEEERDAALAALARSRPDRDALVAAPGTTGAAEPTPADAGAGGALRRLWGRLVGRG